MRIAERRMERLIKGIQHGWNELPRDRVSKAYITEIPCYGVCVVEWRGQAPNYTPTKRRAVNFERKGE